MTGQTPADHEARGARPEAERPSPTTTEVAAAGERAWRVAVASVRQPVGA